MSVKLALGKHAAMAIVALAKTPVALARIA